MTGKSKEEIQRDLIDKGLDRFKENKYKLAINYFSKVIKLNPEYIFMLYGLRGRAYYFLGDYKSALMDLSRSILLDSNNFNSWSFRGATNFALKDYQRALSDFSEALKINPENSALDDLSKAVKTKVLFYKGTTNIVLKDYQSALNDFSEVLKIDPYYAHYDINSEILSPSKREDEILIPLKKSIIDFKKNINLIKLNAKNEKQFLKRGKAKFYLMDYVGAYIDYSEAITLNPYNKDSYLSRSNVSIKLKNFDQSKKDFLYASKIFKKKINKENDDKKIIFRKKQEEYFKLLRVKGDDRTPRWTFNEKRREFFKDFNFRFISLCWLISFIVFVVNPTLPSFFIFLISSITFKFLIINKI